MKRDELRKKWLDEWPPAFARVKIYELSGGALNGRTVANLQSTGQGPEGSFRIGSKVMLSREPTIEWLLSRAAGLK